MNILHIDDNAGDAMLLAEAISEIGDDVSIDIARNGLIALDHLFQVNACTKPRPDLILLDLNMPVMGGVAFLRVLVTHDEWVGIPLIILSSSGDTADRQMTGSLGAVAFILKPRTFAGYVALSHHLIRSPRLNRAEASLWSSLPD